ncbi:hypothetical protein JCM31447_11370 [Fluviispira sanaruensis]|uniref:Uncharacterized protein n=1 Tax=Fluviispira sanaruensis TaxID=2493639 RepID=A0A4P2VTI8_FLUSA|nr:hypothetical protein JCM31447_11370 [Fluviispira sanaruensis]
MQRILNLSGFYPQNYSLTEVINWVNGKKDPKFSWTRQPGEERWDLKKNKIIKNEN